MPLDAPPHDRYDAPRGGARPVETLDEGLLQRHVDEEDSTRRWTVRVLPTTPSTNATLLAALRRGALETPCVLVTDDQSAGRGRRGRAWRSVPGSSLTVSFGLSSERDLASLEGVTLACGLAVRDVLVTLGVDARLKWPNDVVIEGRKLAGILVESLRTARTVLVVGVGLNLTPLPDDAESSYRPIDLATCGVAPVDRHRLVAKIAAALATRVHTFDEAGFATMVGEFNAADAFLDRRVALSFADGLVVTGIERGVDARGALCVETVSERLTLDAGDVSLRLADA